jgi:isopentenyl diphosphate isomerase/L-lactate dehydrogenase-like FMN-dependent dehydrogenase
MLVDTNTRDTKTTIFGHKVSAPIGFAPIGINKIYNPLGELPVAKVAKELNLPYCLSTAEARIRSKMSAQRTEPDRDSSSFTCRTMTSLRFRF